VEGGEGDPDRVADPSASSVPSPTALLSEPDHFVPASVMPRCSGYGIRSDSSRFAAIVFGTFVDLIETLKSVKSRPLHQRDELDAAAVSASTGFSRSSACRCLGSEPELTPIRIGVPAPGAVGDLGHLVGPADVARVQADAVRAASIALSASVWLKWMSAMIGIGDSTTIVLSASTSLSRGHGDAHEVRPRVGHLADLLHRGREVRGLRLGHRLHDDGRAPADLDAADVHVSL
jgi:hypothetical protein